MASNASLEASTQDRKARLAQLRSLKQKQQSSQAAPTSSSSTTSPPPPPLPAAPADDAAPQSRPQPQPQPQPSSLKRKSPDPDGPEPDVTTTYLSGRNYDPATRGAKLGFDSAPGAGQDTIERRAAALALETREAAAREEKEDKPLDLFKLQPKKPNWDLKRDLDRKLERLNVQTDNAIARLVRERIARQQEEARSKGQPAANGGDGVEGAGMEGAELVEALREREKEGREDGLMDEDDDDDDDGVA